MRRAVSIVLCVAGVSLLGLTLPQALGAVFIFYGLVAAVGAYGDES